MPDGGQQHQHFRREDDMLQATRMSRVESSIYTFIGDAGAVTAEELVDFLGVEEFRAQVWLRSQEASGTLYRDETGRYGTSCPWPRVGF
jgi:hypothetical protein